MMLRNGKGYRKLQEEELKRRIERLDVIAHTASEVIKAVNILVECYGLVFCLGLPIIYASHGIPNWVDNIDLCVNEEFMKYRISYKSIQYGSGGLALKAFETYQTYFSTNIKKGKLKDLIPDTDDAESFCCLGICLKNINTGSHDYAFDMIFKLDDDYIHRPFVFLDSLFTKLQDCLPNFKLSSGAQFGRQSLVLDFDTFKAWEKHQLSSPLYKSEDGGYKEATDELKKAISILIESYGVTFCQVWTTRSSNEHLGPDFFMGARNPGDVGCIITGLRNIYAVDIDYVCELFVSSNNTFNDDNNNKYNSCELYDSLFSKLQSCLPSFKLFPSPQFDDHLVIEADSANAWVDQFSPLYVDKDDLKRAIAEIQNAILILSRAHGLTFCQVWTTHLSDKGLDSSFSVGVRNPVDVGIHICWRNYYTVDLDYVFQFFFSSMNTFNNNEDYYCKFFDEVLSTLALTVPSFELSSGPQFDRLVLEADNVIASVDQLSPLIKYVSASVEFAHLKTEISQLFHPVSSKNAIGYRLTYYSFQFSRPLWIQLESDQDLKTCINHCKTKNITQLPIRVVQCHTLNQGFHPRARHATLVISPDEA